MSKIKLLFIILLLIGSAAVGAQDTPVFDSISDFREALRKIEAASDPVQSQAMADQLWGNLKASGQIPLVMGWEVAFVYKGRADTVEWRGDFTGWQESEATQGRQIGQTSLWVMEMVFPKDARIEYKIVMNGTRWLLDPANPNKVMSGDGPNSELKMPDYSATVVTDRRDDVTPGILTKNIRIESESLGYALNYRVYTPAGYESLANLPVIYATDGAWQLDKDMGSLPTALDNLIADGRIKPAMAVFIDSFEPGKPNNNRRESELIDNPDYARFVAEELVPVIDAAYSTNPAASARVIMGTSLGGLAAPYIAILYPDVFQNVIAFSPALWASEEIDPLYEQAESFPAKMFFGTGHAAWDNIVPQDALDFLASKGVQVESMQTSEGHSWATWRAMLDEALLFIFNSEAA